MYVSVTGIIIGLGNGLVLAWCQVNSENLYVWLTTFNIFSQRQKNIYFSFFKFFFLIIWLKIYGDRLTPWWHHNMETFSVLLAICGGNSPVPGEFPAQKPVTWSFDVFFDLRLNKWLSKQSWGWWFEMPSRPLWRHRNEICEESMS